MGYLREMQRHDQFGVVLMEEQGFDPYDQCLTCKMRVGSHSFKEFERCLAKQGRFRDEEE